MADDVKVKIGGDFSGVSKGATDAAAQAGTALENAVVGKMKGIGAAIAGAFAIGALASKAWDGFKEGIAYMHELNIAISRTGQSSGEFQKLAYAGKQAGVSMDIVGRGLKEADKNLANAKNNADARNMFVSLGLDAVKLEAGTYTATEALLALSDQWDKFGNIQKTRAGAVALFGKYGEGMVPVIQQGRSAIEEQTASVREQTRAEILGAAAVEKKIAALERYAEQLKRTAAGSVGAAKIEAEFATYFEDERRHKRLQPEKYQKEHGEKSFSEVAAEKFTKDYKKKYGINAEELNLIMQQATADSPEAQRGSMGKAMRQFQAGSDAFTTARDKGPTKPIEELAGALSASSLQAIGGGDVASVQSGTYQTQMVDLTRQIATNTNPRETPPPPAGPAKAGR